LLASAPEAQAFLRDWPQELIARPVGARSLPVVASLRGLSRLAAPRTRELVEAIEAVAGELDWRQTYNKADFGVRFLEGAVQKKGRRLPQPELRGQQKALAFSWQKWKSVLYHWQSPDRTRPLTGFQRGENKRRRN
jgi:hypothetical protein